MNCPHCSALLTDVTDSWHTFVEAQGAEYLASYVTIWHCSECRTVVGAADGDIEWVLEPEEVLSED
jgi:hypothetical protein